jgi:3'-5' exonuclease
MQPSVIVWDLETVPDLTGFAAANDLVGKSEVEVREAIGEKFPKHIYHSIVCIGALIAHRETDHWAVDAVGAPHVGERTEKQLISAFCDKIAELNPQLRHVQRQQLRPTCVALSSNDPWSIRARTFGVSLLQPLH